MHTNILLFARGSFSTNGTWSHGSSRSWGHRKVVVELWQGPEGKALWSLLVLWLQVAVNAQSTTV